MENNLSECELRDVIGEIISGYPTYIWAGSSNGCEPCSQKHQETLRGLGIETYLNVSIFDRFHVSLRYIPKNSEEFIIIDPTYLQFFKPFDEVKAPPILIGTVENITKELSSLINSGSLTLNAFNLEQFVRWMYVDTVLAKDKDPREARQEARRINQMPAGIFD